MSRHTTTKAPTHRHAGKPRRPSTKFSYRRPRSSASSDASGVRLQKVLASAGFGSRRKCEELITTGLVEVDGQAVSTLGVRVQPDSQQVRVDGVPIKVGKKLYYAVNKPTGVVCTNYDPDGRARVVDMLPPTPERLFTVGRLDRASEGLILVTNDGELAQKLAHPRFGGQKQTRVEVAGSPATEVLKQLRRGVRIAEGLVRADSVQIHSAQKQSTTLEIVLSEGKNREIRRMLARVGHKVLRLKRIAVGSLKLGKLASGHYRPLAPSEVADLMKDARSARRNRPRHDQATLGEDRPQSQANSKPFYQSAVQPAEGEELPDLETGIVSGRSARDMAIVADDVVIGGSRVYEAPAESAEVEEILITRPGGFRIDGDSPAPRSDHRTGRAKFGKSGGQKPFGKKPYGKGGAANGGAGKVRTARPAAGRKPGGKPKGAPVAGKRHFGKRSAGKRR